MSPSADRRRERLLASPQFRDGRFHNTSGLGPDLSGGNQLAVMREFFFGGKKRVPKIEIPVESPIVAWRTAPSSGLRVTWFGHSTSLLEIDGLRILTDPVFGMRASPFSFAGPRRFHPVPATIDQLPSLDVVLLTHDHHDHLNPESIRALAKTRVPFVTSLGVGARLEHYGVDPQLITELDWWEEHTLLSGALSFTATPAQHFSGRSLRDRNKLTLWSSFVIQTSNRKLFFSGDTGLTDELREIGTRFGPFDLSMVEIGAWHPAWGSIHLGPENALRAFEMLGGGTLLPIHWGTFDLALHAWEEPIETLLTHAKATGAHVLTPVIGRPTEPARVEGPTPWWRTSAVSSAVGQRWLPALSD
jgi:L-ascorbate metabolism protein UlaG (beta-lactamase superfamily)